MSNNNNDRAEGSLYGTVRSWTVRCLFSHRTLMVFPFLRTSRDCRDLGIVSAVLSFLPTLQRLGWGIGSGLMHRLKFCCLFLVCLANTLQILQYLVLTEGRSTVWLRSTCSTCQLLLPAPPPPAAATVSAQKLARSSNSRRSFASSPCMRAAGQVGRRPALGYRDDLD